uniref:Tripartite motif-containing protein 16-like n=1 Tax=Erpetoichthys calabaricus TaxID=27687 RepID=A0A8C4TMP5_ERPCA
MTVARALRTDKEAFVRGICEQVTHHLWSSDPHPAYGGIEALRTSESVPRRVTVRVTDGTVPTDDTTVATRWAGYFEQLFKADPLARTLDISGSTVLEADSPISSEPLNLTEVVKMVNQKQLGTTLSEIRKRLEKKEKTLKETRRALEQIKISAERQVQEHEKNFTDLIRCIQKTRRKLTERIREHENREREKAKVVMERLEKEIEELKRRNAELKELSETKDNFHFLQTFSSHCVLPADGDSTSFTVTADFSFEDLSKKVSSLKKSLEKMSQWHILTFTPPGNEVSRFVLLPPDPQSREEFLQYFCPLTLDINTPHRELHLSEGNKKVTWEETEAKYPDHPDRFDWWPQVLCGEALTGTRCYWEVEGSGEDMEIGVAYKGLGRKGESSGCHLGYNDKSWSLAWCNSRYSVCHNNKETVISAPYSPRVGVYLDWPDGSLSFYSVTQTMTLLHKFNTCFTERLYPGFGLVLTPV